MLSIFVLPLLLASAFAYPYFPGEEMMLLPDDNSLIAGTYSQNPNYEICVNENGLKYILNVPDFTEEEIEVTLVENTIFIFAKKSQRAHQLLDGSYFYYGEGNELHQQYTAPEYIDMDPKKVNVTFFEDNKVLIIEALSKQKEKLAIRTISTKVQNHYHSNEEPTKGEEMPVDTTTLVSTVDLPTEKPNMVVPAQESENVESYSV